MLNSALTQTSVTWDTYGIGFTVPDDFTVTSNTAEEFSSENESVYLYITPWHDYIVDEEALIEGVEAAAREFKYDEITDVSEADISDYIGYAVQGKKDGINALIILLLDEQSSTNLVVIMTYEDGHLNQVQNIYNSIYAYDP
jgi:hypothetical protein